MFSSDLISPTYNLETRDCNGQRFYKLPSGIYVPSVTTVVNYGDKPWLNEWKKSLGPKKAEQEVKRCSERGTAIHTMCEKYIQNLPMSDIIDGQTRENVKLFNQIKFALQNKVSNVKLQEQCLFSNTLCLAGRVDLIANYNGILSIIDYKSSTNLKDEDKIENYFLQTTAYALMFEEMYKLPIDQIVVIVTSEKGLMAQTFIKPIYPYVEKLQDQLDYFYKKEKMTIQRINGTL